MLPVCAILLSCTFSALAEFKLPPLPFDAKATEPVISEQANKFHHDNHHAMYVSNLNTALKDSGDHKLMGYTLSELVAAVGADKLPQSVETKVRNNGGGSWNHALWWRILAPFEAAETKADSLSEDLKEEIEATWGSVDDLVDEMKEQGKALFGSGWVWLIVQEHGKLAVMTTANQDNPLMSLVPEEKQGVPIFGIDVWEHAFYLTYGPMKPKYLEDFWSIVNWKQVSKNYELAKKGKLEDLIGREWNESHGKKSPKLA